jgi:diguanylate cyclase
MLDTIDGSGPRKAAIAAIDTLRQLGLPPAPRSVAVLYAYHAGAAPMLRARLDRAFADSGPLPPNLLDDLHAAFIAAQPAADPLAPLVAAAAELIDLAGDAGGQVERFEGLLMEAAGRIEELNGPDLRRLAGGLLALTRRLAQQSAEVSGKLGVTERRLVDLRRQIGDADRATHIDPLTGLGNRRAFDEDLVTLLQERRGGVRPLSVALFRVDRFRRIAEDFGAQVGDAVLRAVAGQLLQALRAADRPSRYGGEEFAVLLPGATADAAMRVADRVRAAVASHDYVLRTSSERIGAVTLSIGVATHLPTEPSEAFLGRVDAALDAAKGSGGNRTVLAPDD